MLNQLRVAKPWLGVLTLAIWTASCGGGDDAAQTGDNNPPPPPNRSLAQADCANLAGKQFANGPVSLTATWSAAEKPSASADPLPAHCVVHGTIDPYVGDHNVNYGIKFEVRLPANWNGRFFYQGGGGNEGAVPAAYGTINAADGNNNLALRQGYAIVTSDGGHETSELAKAGLPSAGFGLDDRARNAWGPIALDKTTTTAKSIVQTAYGSDIAHSYFVGCSTGGRQGMQFTESLPTYFDGVVAGDPVLDLGAISADSVWGLQKFGAISQTDVGGNPLYYTSFSAADQALFTKTYLNTCDASDGVVDGMVQSSASCHFDPAVLQCSGAKDATCLSAAQVSAIKSLVGGPVDSNSAPVKVPGYNYLRETSIEGYPLDTNWMTSAGQAGRLVGTATVQPGNFAQGAASIPYLYIDPPNPSFNALTINWDTYPDMMRINMPWLATNPDISAFKNRGGKVIYYHGSGDPGPTYLNTVNYYNKLTILNGGVAATQKFARLFMVPAMGHCSGGPSADSFDQLTAIVNWVEKGVAPDTIIAKTRSDNTALSAVTPAIPAGRTRPLCPYPSTAKYKGSGDINDAANFECIAPST
jgi:feruloyl esterase